MRRTQRKPLLAGGLAAAICAAGLWADTGWTAMAAPSHKNPPSGVVNGRIAFATEGSHSQIYSVNPDGTDQVQLTHVAAGVQVDMPDWSPDGTLIAYVENASGSNDVWVMNANGSGEHLLTHSDGSDYLRPAWSPDGTHIAVTRCSQTYHNCDIDVMKADGTDRHVVVGGHVRNGDPTWSPDGRYLAFTSNRAGLDSAIWVKDLVDHTLRRLTAPTLDACVPDWSPRSDRILFMGTCDRGDLHLYVMNPNGGRARLLTDDPPGKGSGFGSYSPDGREILYASSVLSKRGTDLFTMNANGLNPQPIVTDHPWALWSDWGTNTSTLPSK